MRLLFKALILILLPILHGCQEFYSVHKDEPKESLIDARPLIVNQPVLAAPLRTYVVRALDQASTPLEGKLVTVSYLEDGLFQLQSDFTDSDGKVTFSVPDVAESVAFEYGFKLASGPKLKKVSPPSSHFVPFSGNFIASTLTTTANANGSIAPLVADFDGDGHLDIFSNLSAEQGNFFWNDGSANFTRAEIFISSTVAFSYNAVAVDWNNDGKIDIALSYLDAIFLLKNKGGRNFEVIELIDNDTSKQIRTLKFVDLNKDGYLDLITISANKNQIVLYYGNESGKFSKVMHLPLTHTPRFVEVDDYNGDGYEDIIVLNYKYNGSTQGSVSFYKGTSDGLFILDQETVFSHNGQNLKFFDLDDDGKKELIVSTSNRFHIMKYNSSSQSFEFVLNAGQIYTGTGSNYATDFVLVDADQNGSWELIITGADRYMVYEIDKDTLVPAARTSRNKSGLSKIHYFSEVVDLNGDNVPDLVAGTSANAVIHLLLGVP